MTNVKNKKNNGSSDAAKPVKKSKLKKAINISVIVVEALILVFILFLTVAIMTSQQNEDKTLSKDPFFKLSFMPVLSDSMKPEFKKGDLIIVKEIKDISTLKKGDIISYWFYKDGNLEINTHRIIEVSEYGVRTQGDNREECPEPDQFEGNYLKAEDIVAVYQGKIAGVGTVITKLNEPVVFFFIIIFPLILLFIYNAFLIVRLIIRYRVQRLAASGAKNDAELTEEMKRKAVEEYLLSQAKLQQDEKTDETKENPDDK